MLPFEVNCLCFFLASNLQFSSEALRLNMLFPARKIWLFETSYVFEWQYVWFVSCCCKLRPVRGRKNGGLFSSAAMAAVHFSPELLSDKLVTLLMINASVRWAVSKLQQNLNPDSLWTSGPPPPSSLRPSTSACPPAQQINGSLSSLRPAAASATDARAKSLLSKMGGNTHALWQGRIQCQRGGRGITAEATFVAGCRHLWLRDSNGFWWGRNWDDWDCYLHVDNQTSAHDVISNGVMRPTFCLQPSRFSADHNLLLALIPWFPFLFSSIQVPLHFYLQVFHLYSFTMSCFLPFLSNDLFWAPPHHHSLWVRPWGGEINDGGEALATFGFLFKIEPLQLGVFFLFTYLCIVSFLSWRQLKWLCYEIQTWK